MKILQLITRMSSQLQTPRCLCPSVSTLRVVYGSHILDFAYYRFFTTQHYCTTVRKQYKVPRNERVRIRAAEPENPSRDTLDCTEDDFGALSQKYSSRAAFRKTSPELKNLRYVEEENEEETEPVKRISRKNTPYWYFLQCKTKIKEGKLAEALELFETKMLKEERLQPEESNYTILIGGCGRAGYVKKAFRLYSDMKKRGLEPTEPTFTALFNACAESPWKDSGLQNALKLRQELKNKNIELNIITYRSLMKVCAMCAGLQSCLDILKETVQKGHFATTDTFNILLMGCIEEKTEGFRYALQVWQQMLRLGLKPNSNTYDLLLRAIKECGIGDSKVAFDVLLRPWEEESQVKHRMGTKKQGKQEHTVGQITDHQVDMFKQQLYLEKKTQPRQSNERGINGQSTLEPHVEKSISPIVAKDLVPFHPETVTQITKPHLPNLLKPNVEKHMVVSLGNVTEPSDRLSLVGEMEGIFQMMQEDQVVPTIKTLTLLADIIKPDSHSESNLISIMESMKLKADLTFFNVLVKKRSKMFNLASAKELLPVLAKRGIAPDIKTFCHLAAACHKKEEGLQLLEDMVNAGVKPNNYIYSTLIKVATKRLDYVYLIEIIRNMKRRNVAPNEVVIRQLEFAAQYPPNFDRRQEKNVYLEKIDGFRAYYNRWLGWMAAEETPHPWEKYKKQKAAGH
uniref:Pentatricopeptide repeat domain 1 n=1 Tax=Leptobrachium leishanense TaxID=445787 RepID=A0A8C5QWN4_9ANUR